MAGRSFDRDTWFNLGGGIVPIGIAVFFFALFVVFAPFGNDPVARSLSLLLVVVPIVMLVITLYLTGRIISEAEHTGESQTARAITGFLAGDPPTGDADEE